METFKFRIKGKKREAHQTVSIDDIIKFLRAHPEIQIREVNPYSVDKLMMLLDNEKLAALEEEFNEHPDGIEKASFVLLMKSAIVHEDEERFRLINGLIKLFNDIDINDDGRMQWSEFTQYIIDAVIGEKDTKFFDARFEKDRELTENEILDKAYSRRTKRYVMSKLTDNSLHASTIKKICYCVHPDLLAVLEQSSKKVKIYNTLDCTVKYNIEPKFEENAFILDCCYSEALNMIGLVCSDRRIIVWENGASSREVYNAKKDILSQGIWYLPLHKFWVTAGVDNRLRIHAIGYSNDRNIGKDIDGAVLPPLKKSKETKEGAVEEEAENDKMSDLRKRLEEIRKKQKFGKKADFRITSDSQKKNDELKRIEEKKNERKKTDEFSKKGMKKGSDSEEERDDSFEFSNRRNKLKRDEKEEEEANKRNAPHEKKITEVCELNIPRRIATCSLDGTIKLWDVSTKTCVVELKDISTARGIRGMSYSHEYGGNLVSYGYETHINVWCPEVSPSQAFIGKLSGHAYTIVCCKFIPMAPNCVSVDDKGNVRIWDIRTLSAIQVISTENTNMLVNELEVVPKHDKFILGGKRMFYFDNSAVSKSIKNFNEDVYAVHADYNSYFHTFTVMTKIDIRIYDVMTGKLKKVFTDLSGDGTHSDFSSFAYGSKSRKFYIGDNAGNIRLYNMKNGELIHGINKPLEEQELDKTKTIKRRENNEISYMLYLPDDKLLLTSSWDSTIRIYDEQEPEESSLLRIMSGAHRDSDIITMDYSSHLSLLASGSANGMIALWDFESGKIESICLGHHADITALKFVDEFPLLISGSADGTVCIWPVRPSNLHQNNMNNCLLRIIHSEWRPDGFEQRIGINSIFCVTGSDIAGISKSNVEGNFPNPQEYREHIRIISEPKNNEPKLSITQQLLRSRQQSEQDKEKEKALEEARNNYLAPNEDTFYCPFNRPQNGDYYETLEDFAKYRELAEGDSQQKKTRVHVYFADQKGYVNILDLTHFLKKRGIQPCQSRKKSDGYQLRRKEWMDVNKVVENSITSVERAKKPFYSVHSFNSLLIKRYEAHSLAINDMSKIQDPPSFITCSPDKRVRIWTMDGALIGELNLVKLGNNVWQFPFDWVKHKLAELEEVFDVLKLIERDDNPLKKEEKEKIKLRYMVTSYGSIDDFFNIYLGEEPIVPEKRSRRMELIENKEGAKLKLPAFLEPRDPRLVVKEFKQAEKKEQDPDKYNFWAKGYKEGEIPMKILKALEDKERELDNLKSGSAHEIKRQGEKKATRFMEPPSSKTIVRSSLPGTIVKAGSKSKLNSTDPMPPINQTQPGGKSPFSKPGSKGNVYNSSGDESLGDIKRNDYDEDEDNEFRTTRPLFSNFSVKNMKRNSTYAHSLVKGYEKLYKRGAGALEDVKYQPGESIRSMKLATRNQIEKFESESQKILGVDSLALSQRAQYYKNLRKKNDSTLLNAGNKDTLEDVQNYKIMANKMFMDNTEKNNPKIIKSNKKLYVS